jgi:hypothetical protein
MRKGQAALEFLTTYGWAIVVLLVMVGTIAYFGILNPSKFTPSRCIISPEFNCLDYQITNDGKVAIQLEQTTGKTIYLQSMNCSFKSVGPNSLTLLLNGASYSIGNPWSPRFAMQATCNFDASSMSALKGTKLKIPFSVTYTTSNGGLLHTADGEIYAEVQ